MKKICPPLLSMALLVSLSACGGTSAASESIASEAPVSSSEVSSQPASESAETSAAPQAPSGSEEAAEAPAEAGGVLIAYFSWSGNTEQMAQTIQAEIGGDLFKIEPAVPYTEDYDTLLDIAQQEQAEDARPELAAQVENWDSYDVIFVGYPNWWSDAPMAVYSFLEAYDWTGKTLVPFCTSGGSGFGRSLDKLPGSAPGDVAAWVDGLGL